MSAWTSSYVCVHVCVCMYVLCFSTSLLHWIKEKKGEGALLSSPFVRLDFYKRRERCLVLFKLPRYSVRTCTIILEYLCCDKEPTTTHWNNDFRWGCFHLKCSTKIIRLFDIDSKNLCNFFNMPTLPWFDALVHFNSVWLSCCWESLILSLIYIKIDK